MKSYDQEILEHYRQVAEEDGASSSSTMKDEYIRSSENEIIDKFIQQYLDDSGKKPSSVKVADIGCGNGATLEYLSNRYPDICFWGYEYSPELRNIASERFVETNRVSINNIDIREKDSCDESFDLCYTQRVVINLLDKSDQKSSIKNITDLVNESGRVLFVEGFQSGIDNLNEARAEFDLSPLDRAYHNKLLDNDFFNWVDEFGLKSLSNVDNHFLSSYFYIARVLHPVLLGNKEFKRNSHFVKYMSSFIGESYGEYSLLQAYGFSKR